MTDFTLVPGTRNIFHRFDGDNIHLKYSCRKFLCAETVVKKSDIETLASLPDHKQSHEIKKAIEGMDSFSHRHAEVRQLVLAVERGDVVL